MLKHFKKRDRKVFFKVFFIYLLSNLLCMYTEKGERTRQHFIEVSAGLFNKKGYAGTAVSEILDAAGYSKGALYRTFTDKDELSLEAFKYNLGKLHLGIMQSVNSKKSAMSKLLAIPEFYIDGRVEEIVPGGCPILNTAIEVDDTDPLMNQVVQKAFSNWKKMMVEIIESGKSANEFHQDVNAEELAFYIIATIEGSITLAKTFKNKHILNANMKRLKITIQNGS